MARMVDVARAAGVSVTTVSHVVNDTRSVSPATRERVERAVASTGYRRNALASALVTSRTHTIGLSVSMSSNPYLVHLLRSMERRATERGYTIVMRDSHDDPQTEHRVVSALLDWQVDGLVVAPVPAGGEALQQALDLGVPVVLIDRFLDLPVDMIAPDNTEPARALTRHLIERGHARLGIVAGMRGLHSTVERVAGVRLALEAFGAEARFVEGGSDPDIARDVVRDLCADSATRPTGLVVLNNSMTVGAMRALTELGLRVPDDIALVCYDDFEWADLFEPRLTAVAQDVEAMGVAATDLVVDRIEGDTSPPRALRTPTTLVHRTSCGCPRDAAELRPDGDPSG